LAACTDERETTKTTWQKLTKEEEVYNAGTVGTFAWEQLAQTWQMDTNARKAVVEALDHNNAIICAATALLLRNGRPFSREERKVAAQKIMVLLKDDELSRRPLDPPDQSNKVWRLDDVLFETLRAIVEQIK